MIKKYNSHIIAVVGTLIFMVIVFLLLWFLRMTMTPPTDEEDIEVMLEYELDVEEILEQEENVPDELPQQQDVEKPTTATQPPKTPTQKSEPPKSSNNNPLINDNNETLTENTDTVVDIINKYNWDTLLGENEQSPTVKDTIKEPQKPGGSGKKGDISWSLEGRGNIKLPLPKNEHTQTCTVYIDVWVDENGDVKSATVSGKTITSDNGAVNAAISAALQAKFTPGEGMVKGTITYKFIMK